jgi:uncharacterized membrane protein YdjX (TVP38/TMEM64 family)
MKKVIAAILLLLLMIIGLKYFGYQKYLTFEYLKLNQQNFALYYQENQILAAGLYFILYIVLTSLSIPGANILTLLGGFLFGNLLGVILVSFASTIGATFAFLICRYLFSDFFRKRFSKFFQQVNEGIEKDGPMYLMSLRLIPIIPYWLINLTMGLTTMKVYWFYFISQIGMFPATLIYVNAGTQLSSIESTGDIFTLKMIISFSLLGIFPFLAKWFLKVLKHFIKG